MLEKFSPVMQAFLGTLFTWGLTAAGAALVLFVRGTQRKLLDSSLGFAAGVMIAASYWSLLAPGIEMAVESRMYGSKGEYAFIPVGIGFILGSVFVYGADVLINTFGLHSTNLMVAMHAATTNNVRRSTNQTVSNPDTTTINGFVECGNGTSYRRRPGRRARNSETITHAQTFEDVTAGDEDMQQLQSQWKRIMLLVIAITVHNIPEGLAVGVGFGAIGSSESATFENARNLAIGIGIQNFPEGLAVSLPLQSAGFSTWKSLWYGQLSGMVEPLFGVLGAIAVGLARPALPYALSFAAGAMIYVVVDDIIPEANTNGNGKLATFGAILGFLLMMSLDVGLG